MAPRLSAGESAVTAPSPARKLSPCPSPAMHPPTTSRASELAASPAASTPIPTTRPAQPIDRPRGAPGREHPHPARQPGAADRQAAGAGDAVQRELADRRRSKDGENDDA